MGVARVVCSIVFGGSLQRLAAPVSGLFVLFLGAVSCALASALFWAFARRAGDRELTRMTAAAFVVLCGAALILWRLL